MTTSMIAWHRTMRSPLTTSTERECAFLLVCQRSVVSHHSHTHALWLKLKKFAPSPHPHVHGHLCVLLTLTLPFYFLLYHPPLFFFLLNLKSVVNLHNSANESMDSTNEPFLSTGYEPKAHDFYETSVESCMQLLPLGDRGHIRLRDTPHRGISTASRRVGERTPRCLKKES